MIGLIAAMEEELSAVVVNMTNVVRKDIADFTLYQGKLNNKDVVICQSGVGKVQAAMATTLLIDHFPLKAIINVGIAGSLQKGLTLRNVVIADKIAQWDFDLSAFGIERGYDNERYTTCVDPVLLTRVQALMKDDKNLFIGPMVTGDQFVYLDSQLTEIKNAYPDALCVDMEGGAIAQVCAYFKLPFMIIRSISDLATEKDNENVYEDLIRSASETASKYCMNIVGLF